MCRVGTCNWASQSTTKYPFNHLYIGKHERVADHSHLTLLINLQSLGLFQNIKETLKSLLPPKDDSHFPARSGYPGLYFCTVKAEIIFFCLSLRLPWRCIYFSFHFFPFLDRLVVLSSFLSISDIITRHAQYL